MKNGILLEGDTDFVDTYMETLSMYTCVLHRFNEKIKKICIWGSFEPKEILFKGGILGEQVYWMLGTEWVDIYDIHKLIGIEAGFLQCQNWKMVKLINKIIREVEIYQKVTAVHYFPSRLQIEHSTICNAECIMCSHYFTNNYRRGFIDDVILDKIEPLLPYVDKILLHGIGEAFLHPHIQKYLKLYAKYDIEVSCITNMSYMDEKLAYLIGKTFKSITISCDGATKDTFERIRRGISFEQFCNNIRMLHNIQPNIELRFNVVCMRQNIKEMPGIVQLAASLGVQAVGISGLIARKSLDNLEDEIYRYPLVATYYLKRTEEMAKKIGVRLLQIPEYVYNISSKKTYDEEIRELERRPFFHSDNFKEQLYAEYRKLDVIKPTCKANLTEYAIKSEFSCQGICDYLVECPFIGVTGEMTTCCIDGIHLMGNIIQDSFVEIWNSDVYKRLREIYYQNTIPKFCVGCMFLKDNTKMERIVINRHRNDFFVFDTL